MIKKKYVLILLLLIVSICTISAVSASDSATDLVAVDDANADDVVSNLGDDVISSVDETDESEELDSAESDLVESDLEEIDDGEKLTATEAKEDESLSLSLDNSDEVLSATAPTYDNYYVFVSNATISSTNGGNVSMYISPAKSTSYRPYDFWFRIYKTRTLSGNTYYFSDIVYEKNLYSTSEDRADSWYSYAFNPGLSIGTYYIGIVNWYDDTFMSHSVLTVIENATISCSDYNAYYNSGKKMSIRVTDKTSGKGLSSINLKVVFSNSKKTVTKYYTTDSNGYATFVPPVGVGTYTVTISPTSSYVKAAAIKRTAKVKKSKVKIKAYKITEYKGFKVKIKAKVTSQGKKVNEGKVTFRINGKTYKVKVKNGLATKTLKLKKVKIYKYTAKFAGANFYKSKKANGKVTIKKRFATKIIINSRQVYSNAQKVITIKVLTKSGKKVKNGKLKGTFVNGVGYYTVKNGKAKVGIQGLGNEHLRWFNGITSSYKKYIKKSAKFTYIPSSHKYKSSTKKVKLVSKFRCNCGRTTSHNHYGHSYGYAYGNVNTYVTDRVIIS